MTVKELKRQLEKCNDDAVIWLEGWDNLNECLIYSKSENFIEYDKDNNEVTICAIEE